MAEWITEFVEKFGYWGIGFLMFLENVFPPIPSELIMPLGGFAASQGELTFLGVCVAGAVGSVVGQLPLYYLGWALGEERIKSLADRYGKWLMLDGEDVAKASAWFDRHGGKAVLICRLVPGVRSLISIPAGIRRMNLLKFLAFSALGMTVWAIALAWAGSLLGRNYERVGEYLGPVTYVVVGVLLVLFIIWAIRKRNRKKAKQQALS